MNPKIIELLAPAKNKDVAINAINCGADAIYIGASQFGARASAGNAVEDIKSVVDYAHLFNVKVYVTINTILKDEELHEVEKLIVDLYNIHVDALIIQDMGILRLNIPPISLHASTQCDIRTIEKAKFLESVGFSQLVLARELNLTEIKQIHESTNIPLEAFIHGALCVSYSGKCHASHILKGRSANRGECAQICRLPYDLIDITGKVLESKKHFLSLKDLNQSENIKELMEAGISSFKIEGRLKDSAYVENVVSFYRKKIDTIISENPEKYCRSSLGRSTSTFTPQLDKSFNRNFTEYFLKERYNTSAKMASFNTPKSIGEVVGKVSRSRDKEIQFSGKNSLNNGDGISYFDQSGEYKGFRVNKCEGKTIYTLSPINISPGTILYRTFDKKFNDEIESDKSIRKILVDIKLSEKSGKICLEGRDQRGISSSVIVVEKAEQAKSNQQEAQKRILSKLGNTIFELNSVETIDNLFIPASLLSEARRTLLDNMNNRQILNYAIEQRLKEDTSSEYIKENVDFRENISNSLSEEFYKSHGVKSCERAVEVSDNTLTGDEILMNTRYCILKEIGCCKKMGNKSYFKEPLLLRRDDFTLQLEFDCKNCEMKIRKFKEIR